MRAEIITVGTELLLGHVVNTNTSYLGQELAGVGINLFRQVTVGDNLERIASAISTAWEENDLVIVTGGLGPTEDDLTREGIALALNLKLIEEPDLLAGVESFFQGIHKKMSPNNKKQALLPEGAEPLANQEGTAPGIYLCREGKVLVAMPGVPGEMRQMFAGEVVPRLERMIGSGVIHSRIIRVTGIGESSLETEIKEFIDQLGRKLNPTLALLAKGGEIEIRLTALASGEEEAEEIIKPWVAVIKERLGDKVYGYDDDTLESVVNCLLQKEDKSLAIAESCTGGLLGHRLTSVPGSSKSFLGGIIAYSNQAKEGFLAVPAGILAEKGAVSPETASYMAKGVREHFGADFGLAITGIAGPGGGTSEKPMGLVYIALASGKERGGTAVIKCQFHGHRERVKYYSSQRALDMLRLHLIDNNK
ncbi:MAG: competence/damage-inducible protein A [Halanaerobium sp.]|nr:competence/damage-inducible protein A [Halanaerobium sp.]